MRANVNKARKQAKRGECLPCERLVQGKRHVGKESSASTRHFIESSVFLPHRIWKCEVQG